MNMIFGELEALINLIEKFKKYFNFLKKPVDTESVATRFIRLFETHGVHRNQIPRFFGHGITLKDLQDAPTLIAKLDEEVLSDACKLFAIRREWLDGADEIAHSAHNFYKKPEEFLTFIKNLKVANPNGELDGELFSPDMSDFNAEEILVLNEIVGYVGNEVIYRYHLCNNWLFSYWKSRAYLTACVATAWKHEVYVRGFICPKKSINRLAQGEVLLASKIDGVASLFGKKWYPEDMALLPEVFLKDIDPERDHYGYKAGLSLWLSLEEKGLMDTGVEKSTKLLFLLEYQKYLSN